MSVFSDRALPVLQALASSDDEHVKAGFLTVGHGRAATSLGVPLEDGVIHDTLLALGDVDYVEWSGIAYETGPGAHFHGLRVTGRGQQVLGQWPFFELMITPSTLALTVDRLVEAAPDDDRGRLERLRGRVSELSVDTLKSAAIGAAGALARHKLGLP